MHRARFSRTKSRQRWRADPVTRKVTRNDSTSPPLVAGGRICDIAVVPNFLTRKDIRWLLPQKLRW
jgi:hypothetical protein